MEYELLLKLSDSISPASGDKTSEIVAIIGSELGRMTSMVLLKGGREFRVYFRNSRLLNTQLLSNLPNRIPIFQHTVSQKTVRMFWILTMN